MSLENDELRELVIDIMMRDKYTVTEAINKLRYIMKEDVNEAYIKGYGNGQKDRDIETERYGTKFPDQNPNL